MPSRLRDKRAPEPDITPLVRGYKPLPGIADEMVGADGQVRPHWRPLLQALAAAGPQQLARDFQAADRHLYQSGVFYRVYDDPKGGERVWPLSHVPLLLDAAEWRHLEAGMIERAELMEAILGDVYGRGTFVSDGALPAAVVAGSPEYLRPLVNAEPRRNAHLWIYAADVGRGPDGRFWVIADRTQAPSGAGYVVENRLALARAMPDIFRKFNVERLAGFFDGFRASLAALNRSRETRVVLLTPGPMNETYFEHAYLARYLGFLLVTPDDLVVRGDTVFVRTVAGLKEVDVIVRRLDSDFADPLELNAASQLGIPGLVRAVHAGRVAVANALGSGLVESRALLSFLPALARRVLGHDLTIPNVATWWCGQAAERDYVMQNLDDLVVAHAFRPGIPGLAQAGARLGSSLGDLERRRLGEILARRGVDVVGQEVVNLSTTPVWTGTGLEARPYLMRLFVARTPHGWKVMPGAFCRVSDSVDPRAVSMQAGGRSADVWVPAEGKPAELSLIPAPEDIRIRRSTGTLPSRVAENLFWLGRYIERVDATLRLVRALAARLAESGRGLDPAAKRLAEMLFVWGAAPPLDESSLPAQAITALTGDAPAGSVPRLAAQARRSASVIRERLSPDAWRALVELERLVLDVKPANESDVLDLAQRALGHIAAFSGLAQENMIRLVGWRFLEIGRRIERALSTSRFVRRFAFEDAPAAGLDALIELADSQITYRMRYVMVAARAPAIDLVLLDPGNPRSVAFQLERIAQHLTEIPGHDRNSPLAGPERIARKLATDLATSEPDDIDIDQLLGLEQQLMELSNLLSAAYFTPRRPAAIPEPI